MPTYDYVCDGCGHQFEEWQSFKDEPLTKCPSCKKNKLRRLFGGGAAIIFKGSGFYETDYRKDSYKEAAKADAPPAAGEKSDASSSTKTETPTPAKTDTGKSGKSSKSTKTDK